MPDIPAKAVHDMANRKLLIDGEEFPWSMDAAGPVLANRTDGVCTVTLTFLVDAIEVLPIPAKSAAEAQAELNAIGAQQRPPHARESSDLLEVRDAQFGLLHARAELARHTR